MGFLADIQRFNVKAEGLVADVKDGVDAEMFRSVVHGSEITGAPGQPVSPDPVPEAGNLRDSWTMEHPDENTTIISTPVDYAPDVEDNLKGKHFSNHGPHSVKLTVAGFDRIVDVVAQRVADQ